MDSPESDLYADSSDPSTAAPTPADSNAAQTSPDSGGTLVPDNMGNTAVLENDDSDSDVSMSADTDDEIEELTPQTVLQISSSVPLDGSALPAFELAIDGTRKRKHWESAQEPFHDNLNSALHKGTRKRLKPDEDSQQFRTMDRKLPVDRTLLPPEIWHYIFSFCPPKALGSLLQVNKCFRTFLDSASQGNPNTTSPGAISKLLLPDAIWRASRLSFHHGMPGPLVGQSELNMWRLACGSICQFCDKEKSAFILPGDQWHPGPGVNGVSPIWSFGVRSCGSCLEQNSTKEIDLLLSSSIPSPLMAALPFVFVTDELHVLPATILQVGRHPPTMQIAKRFFILQIEDIKREFDNVKALGSAAAEEWLKGLDARGKERRNDAARWERWEAVGGVANMRQIHNKTPKLGGQFESVLSATIPTSSTFSTSGTSSDFTFQPSNPTQQPMQISQSQGPSQPQSIISKYPANIPGQSDITSQNGYASLNPRHPRHERTKEEVAQLKAARRAEIERRCMLLEPPLTAGVLAHMSSFQAAIQIIQPLDDGAWEVLKPRLLSQREEAEQRENDRLTQTRVVQERFDQRQFQDAQIKPEDKDLTDREWDDVQAPLRARIGGYADEIIRDGWIGGDKVTYDNCPKFAVDVLIYVRKRFYAEVAKDEAAVRATGREPETDPPHGPYLRKLILENMKWVFDTKIKPFTEPYRKELFLCNACEVNSKHYGFEGVIQHYAAKHTNALSMGSIVVHWKSEWPEQPPFNPDPMAVTNGPYYASALSTSGPYPKVGPSQAQNYGYGGYQSAPVPAPIQAPGPPHMQAPLPIANNNVYQESTGPYFGQPQFGDQYSGHQNGSYPTAQSYPNPSNGYHAPQYSMAPIPNKTMGYAEIVQDHSHPGFGGAYPASGYPPSQSHYQTIPEAPPHQQPYVSQGDTYSQPYSQPYNPQSSYQPSEPAYVAPKPPKTEEYKIQLQDISKTSREVWNTIGPLKEAPGSIKVYTIIYHFLKKSRASFPDDPPLEMVIDGLNHHKEMRACRNINGLLCKACALGIAGATPATQKKHFSFPQLLNHFRDCHTSNGQNFRQNSGYTPDWTTDMVELPDISKLSSLINSSDHRLKLIKEALPEIFTPTITDPQNLQGENQSHVPTYQVSHEGLALSQDTHDRYYTTTNSGPTEPSDILYDHGEYDPRNPQELPVEPRPIHKLARRVSYSRGNDIRDNRDERYVRYEDEQREDRSRLYLEQRHLSPPRTRASGEYERMVIREDAPIYIERHPRDLEDGVIEYRLRREHPPLIYEERAPLSASRDHRPNYASYQASGEDYQPLVRRETRSRDGRSRPAEDPRVQQNRVSEVVAQISQQAQQAKERLPPKEEPDFGSEDGELRADPIPRPETRDLQPVEEANAAAERFLNDFLPEEPHCIVQKVERGKGIDPGNRRLPSARAHGPRYMQDSLPEVQSHLQDRYEVGDQAYANVTRPTERFEDGEYVVHEVQPSRQARAAAYGDRYESAASEQRQRSPELVDRRYKLNNVIYRDERQSSHGTRRTPSRYARYESVRLEHDRARSRSPVYVKMGGQPGQYREHSPVPHRLYQEPSYRSATARLATEKVPYERAPRQEYQRIYAHDHRPRESREEAYELVRVTDSQGEFMIRRPIRREPAPVHAAYEDDGYARQPLYESRPPVARPNYTSYEQEEYDPRHPEAPQQPFVAPPRQVSRYE